MKSVEELIGHYLNVPSILVFSSEQLKRSVIKELQQNYSFCNQKHLTFNELKRLLYLPQMPSIKGEKRSVAFFNAISDEVKKFFNLTDYFDVSIFAGKFFRFFETLQEAGCSEIPSGFFESTSDSENQLKWQENTYAKLLEARVQYLGLLEKNDYVDELFIDNAELCEDVLDWDWSLITILCKN